MLMNKQLLLKLCVIVLVFVNVFLGYAQEEGLDISSSCRDIDEQTNSVVRIGPPRC